VSPKVLAILGALAIALGIGMVFVAGGVIAAGIEMVAGAYLLQYLEAKRP